MLVKLCEKLCVLCVINNFLHRVHKEFTEKHRKTGSSSILFLLPIYIICSTLSANAAKFAAFVRFFRLFRQTLPSTRRCLTALTKFQPA